MVFSASATRVSVANLSGGMSTSSLAGRIGEGSHRRAVSHEDSRWLRKLARLPEARTEKIRRLRAQIAAGTCDTPEKLDAALDRMLDELPLELISEHIDLPRRV
jgi:hypothetical protein